MKIEESQQKFFRVKRISFEYDSTTIEISQSPRRLLVSSTEDLHTNNLVL